MWSAWTDTFQEETERKKNILKIVKVLNNLPLNDEILSIHFSALNGKEKKVRQVQNLCNGRELL